MMESFHKVIARQQKMIEHYSWRNKLTQKYVRRFGYSRAVSMMLRCGIQFDTQVQPEQIKATLDAFDKNAGMPVLVQISLS